MAWKVPQALGPDGKPKEVPISPEKRPVTGADAEKLPAKTKIIIGPDGAPVEVPVNSAAPPKKK